MKRGGPSVDGWVRRSVCWVLYVLELPVGLGIGWVDRGGLARIVTCGEKKNPSDQPDIHTYFKNILCRYTYAIQAAAETRCSAKVHRGLCQSSAPLLRQAPLWRRCGLVIIDSPTNRKNSAPNA